MQFQFLNFKTARNAISQKIDLFDFTSFFAWTFLNSNYLNSTGESQLQQLVKDPGHTDEEIELLIKEGSNVNHADKSGYRPLHDAALSNCSNYVKVSFAYI